MRKVLSHFINFPIAVNLVVIAFVVFGAISMWTMRSSFYPQVDSRFITISISYSGASPLEIEEGIVLKIEDNLKGVVGVDRVTSESIENEATITIEVEKGQNVDLVLNDVRNAIDQVSSFPAGMDPPVISKDLDKEETLSFAISGQDVPLRTLKAISRRIENDIRAIEGISQVGITGFPKEEIEVAVSENDLRAFNLTFEEVARAVSEANILVTGGNIKTDAEEYLIRANNRFYYGDELDNLIVRADPSGNSIRLKDVAEVRDRWAEDPSRIYFNGEPSVRVRIKTTNNEDLISSAAKIREYVKRFNQQYNNVQLHIIADVSRTLKERTQLLVDNGIMGIILVLIFLSLFLNSRMAFWVASGLPVAFLGMFIFALKLGLTINVFSLFGMIIVIGILVDDGIVIAENIYDHYQQGKSRVRAAVEGTLEVIPPIMSALLTTTLAFSAFYFMDGDIGDLFGEVATVVIITLSVSLVEALIILPAHIAHSKALSRNPKKNKLNVITDKFMDFMKHKIYGPALKFVLNNKFLSFSIIMGALLLTIGGIAGGVIKTTFFPAQDSDRVTIDLSMPQGTNEAITDSIITRISRVAYQVNLEFTEKQTGNIPVITSFSKRIGPGTNRAYLDLDLMPGDDRDFAAYEVSNAIQERVGMVHGAEKITYSSGSNFGGKPVSISLISNNIQDLKEAKVELKQELEKNPLLKDVLDNDPVGIKEIKIRLKENAYPLGLTLQSVMDQVRYGFFGFEAQRFQRGQDEIRVWVRYDRSDRSSIKNLDNMWITTDTGSRIPFSEIARYEIQRGEVAINHLDGQREILVEADMVDPNGSATDILEDLRERVMPEIISRHPSVNILYEGQNRQASKLTASLSVALPVILFLIYAVIAFTFRSYSQPLLLLCLVPFSVIGVAWGHWIHGFPINMLSWMGIIALLGVMINDGLVFMEKFNSFLKEGLKMDEALFNAGVSRFRAIFLTSATTVAGLLPLLLEPSRSAQFLVPMGISLAYGMMVATCMTLLILPLFITFSNSVKVHWRWLVSGKMPAPEEVERAIKEKNVEHHEA
ncbi:efflux RND transporter permease subunit [Xanthovirga aplysinae]|uniref:efflux RND transporter permease subunit n=1 Tax=Xanthovirga aplysinae TaxID=2529853 RepID=UPI0012BC0176|nr:efflux RND transporter permease subunit [Xanthovirga aplysinae]MTI32798.1 efflux RND transporter permease subunit [Xanthovirga aplysinae]